MRPCHFHYFHRARFVVVTLSAGLLAFTGSLSATAAPLAIPQAPIFLSTAADPNVMLLIDNSGSMHNVVPDTPYAQATTYYTCPVSQTLSENDTINIRITPSGQPYFVSGSTAYAWSDSSGSTPIGGQSFTNKCFDPTKLYSAMLYAGSGTPGTLKTGANGSPALYKGNYLNWYFGSAPTTWGTDALIKPGQQRRIDIAKNAATVLVDSLSEVRLGLSAYNGSNGVSILQPIGDVVANKGAVKTAISTLTPGGFTPLAEALRDIGEYYSLGATGNLTLHPGQAGQASVGKTALFARADYSLDLSSYANPVQYFCQKNSAVILTDGRPNGDKDISTYLQDYDGDCTSPTGYTCDTFDRKPASLGYTYESDGTDYLDDVAKALYDIDLRPDLNDFANQPVKNNVSTYTIGFADEVLLTDKVLPDTATNGGGENFLARNAGELAASFQAALASIVGRTASGSAIAANSSRIATDTRIYQARFSSTDWTGELLAFSLNTAADAKADTTGNTKEGSIKQQVWSGRIPLPAARGIFSLNSETRAGIEFKALGDLSAAQTAAVPSLDLLNYLRGDTSKELRKNSATNPATFRNRTNCDPIVSDATHTYCLGDIVNFDPLFVGGLNFGYELLPDGAAGRDTYTAFRNANKKTRTPMVYAGANDGMLHAFDATTGIEKFAYVPNAVFPNLPELAKPNYGHRYFVDGPATAGDSYFDSAWHTILVGTTGAGGRAVFALDVTDPDNFGAGKVLWEFTETNTGGGSVNAATGLPSGVVNGDPDLGLTMSQPAVVRLQNGDWVAIFGNGYNSANQKAMLFIVDLKTGNLIKKIDTGAGSATTPNGLASAVLIPDANRTVAYAYAGDLLGNMWKFDLSGGTPSSWGLAFSGNPLFKAQIGTSPPQPITAAPDVAAHPQGGYLIAFGTGKYLENADNQVPASPQIQSFYGIWDKDNTAISGTDRLSLQKQSIDQEVIQSGLSWRVTSKTPVDWDSKRGWYLDLISPVDIKKGERVMSSPRITDDGRVVFTTYIPSSQACKPEGDSWLMQLDLLSGARLGFSVFDVNNDGKFTAADKVTTSGSATELPSGVSVQPGATDNYGGLAGSSSDTLVGSRTDGSDPHVVRTRGGLTSGRQSWRQLY